MTRHVTPPQLPWLASTPAHAVLDAQGRLIEISGSGAFLDAHPIPHFIVGACYDRDCQRMGTPEAQELARLVRAVLDDRIARASFEYATPAGERWYQLRITRAHQSHGVHLDHEDVTTRKHSEENFRAQTELNRTLLESSPDCVKLLSLQGELLWMNEGGLDLMEIGDFHCFEGADWQTFWPEDAQTELQRALDSARRGETGRFQAHCPTAKGTLKFWDVVITPINGPDGQPAKLLCTSRDLTPLREAQHVALQRQNEIRRALHHLQSAFFNLDHDWRFTYVNPHAEQLIHKSASDLIGVSIWDALPETLGSAFEQQYRLAVRERRPLHFEAYHAPLLTWFEMHAHPHPEGLAVLFHDVTRTKAAQQTQQERYQALEMTVQGRPLPEILRHVSEMLERQSPEYTCVIQHLQDGKLYVSAAPSLPPALQQVINAQPAVEGRGACATAAATGAFVVVEDIATHRDSAADRQVLLPHRLHACAAQPITDRNKAVLGVISLYQRTPGAFPPRVLRVLREAAQLAALAIEHERLSAHLRHQAKHDALTGLGNRALFEERLMEATRLAQRDQTPLALLYFDVNDFKGLNDTLGHQAGDAVLKDIAQRLTRAVRHVDTAARISGDEFTVILPGTNDTQAMHVARRVVRSLSEAFVINGTEVNLAVSMGVCAMPDGGGDAETLQRHADLALYHAKTSKTAVVLFEPALGRQAYERFQLASYLRRAVELNELELHYQPQLSLHDHRVTGVEALLRWRHPHLGLVSPAQFIPIAEETGLIIPIGEWVLGEACRQGVAWLTAGKSPVRMAVNVSALQFGQPDFVQTVQDALRDTGYPAELLELELTESVVMLDVEASARRMRQLRDLGVSIAVDDFGTGYSSLSYLPRLPINVLKIDRSFITGLSASSVMYPVVKAMLSLADGLNLDTVAEGIETNDEREVLQQLGCHFGQGYLFARPSPAEDPYWQTHAAAPYTAAVMNDTPRGTP